MKRLLVALLFLAFPAAAQVVPDNPARPLQDTTHGAFHRYPHADVPPPRPRQPKPVDLKLITPEDRHGNLYPPQELKNRVAFTMPGEGVIIPWLPGEEVRHYIRRSHAMFHPVGISSLNLTLALLHGGGTPPPTCTGTNYYVSSSGNNANNGTSPSTPWQTVAKLNSGPAGKYPADSCIHFLSNLSGNLVLDTGSNVAAGTSLAHPVTLDCGGNTLTTTAGGVSTQAILANNIPGVIINNCVVRNGAGSGSSATQVGIYTDGTTNSLVSNNNVGGFLSGSTAYASYDIFDQSDGSWTAIGNTVSGVSGVTSQDDVGIYTKDGTGAKLITGNTVLNIGGRTIGNNLNGETGEGIEVNGNGPCSGCTAEVSYNLVDHIGANPNACGGPSGILVFNSDKVTRKFNEMYAVQPAGAFPGGGCDYDGGDDDGGTSNSTTAYEYTHDNCGSGQLLWMGDESNPWHDNTLSFFISENDYNCGYNNSFVGALDLTQTGSSANNPAVHHGTIYQGSGHSGSPAVAFTANSAPHVFAAASLFADNIIASTSGNSFIICGVGDLTNLSMKANGYWLPTGGTGSWGSGCPGGNKTTLAAWQAVAPGGEVGSTTANPHWAGPVPLGTPCTWTPAALTGPQPCPAGYQLTNLSTAYLGTEYNVTLFGLPAPTRGYFPGTIASPGNIGADDLPHP